MQLAQARLKEALAGTNTTSKEKGPPVADGILCVTPDAPDVQERRQKGIGLDCVDVDSSYLEDGDAGPRPHELYGKFTWRIDNFSETSKRELRSNVFEIGSYKWYILVYPQGCDVSNHLSLFLCVADYEKLLPGWSHFAQFTIAVVNSDPKKSKYSDTLHRFCKKEHDWGWKKFMELSKVLDGFTADDRLIIKAQVQVIHDSPSRPFRCLDMQYRRELVRVYITNVENICRRFIEEKRDQLWQAIDGASPYSQSEAQHSFQCFWNQLNANRRAQLLQEKASVMLPMLVKRFFNEKEVTSTLVMDALFAGCRQLEAGTRSKACSTSGSSSNSSSKATTCPHQVVFIDAERGTFYLEGDALQLWTCTAFESLPSATKAQDAAVDGSTSRGEEDESLDGADSDERKLAELGRRTIEMYVISHIFSANLQAAFREEQALRKQELLIAEVEEANRLEDERAARKAEADKERRQKKKQRRKQKKEAEEAKRVEEDKAREKEDACRRAEAARRAEEAAAMRQAEEERHRERERERAAAAAKAKAAAAKEKAHEASESAATTTTTAAAAYGGDCSSSLGNTGERTPTSVAADQPTTTDRQMTAGSGEFSSMTGSEESSSQQLSETEVTLSAGGSSAGWQQVGPRHKSGSSTLHGTMRGTTQTHADSAAAALERDALQRENHELRARASSAESQVAALERTVTAKDREISRLRQQLANAAAVSSSVAPASGASLADLAPGTPRSIGGGQNGDGLETGTPRTQKSTVLSRQSSLHRSEGSDACTPSHASGRDGASGQKGAGVMNGKRGGAAVGRAGPSSNAHANGQHARGVNGAASGSHAIPLQRNGSVGRNGVTKLGAATANLNNFRPPAAPIAMQKGNKGQQQQGVAPQAQFPANSAMPRTSAWAGGAPGTPGAAAALQPPPPPPPPPPGHPPPGATSLAMPAMSSGKLGASGAPAESSYRVATGKGTLTGASPSGAGLNSIIALPLGDGDGGDKGSMASLSKEGSTPLTPAPVSRLGSSGYPSPGLQDFQHMGLIEDLLDA